VRGKGGAVHFSGEENGLIVVSILLSDLSGPVNIIDQDHRKRNETLTANQCTTFRRRSTTQDVLTLDSLYVVLRALRHGMLVVVIR
jgi:hypothetical protein